MIDAIISIFIKPPEDTNNMLYEDDFDPDQWSKILGKEMKNKNKRRKAKANG